MRFESHNLFLFIFRKVLVIVDGNRFIEIVEQQLEWCKRMLLVKGEEYGTEDRLHNFKIARSVQQCSEEQALAGMMTKHIVSIYDMCKSGEAYTEERWNEKIGDSINYLLLLRALIEDTKKITHKKSDARDARDSEFDMS